jgi:3-deoxy-manno-octulosonate cytidylyltransferase (CMP-KDO synthetase)
MKTIAVIPARYASTRFPAKLMEDLCGKTVILTTYQAAVATNLFDDVFVVTDSELIFNEIVSNRGKAIRSIKNHESGSDRIAEAIEKLEVDIIIHVQGDEPFVDSASLEKILAVFKDDVQCNVDLVSLMRPISDAADIKNHNNVKVVVDQNQFALYFSRSVIPYPREINAGVTYMQHIGIYGFRKQALLDFYNLPMKSLEASEKLEQLRYLEFGKKIKMVTTNHIGIGIDTIEDLERARALILKQ